MTMEISSLNRAQGVLQNEPSFYKVVLISILVFHQGPSSQNSEALIEFCSVPTRPELLLVFTQCNTQLLQHVDFFL